MGPSGKFEDQLIEIFRRNTERVNQLGPKPVANSEGVVHRRFEMVPVQPGSGSR